MKLEADTQQEAFRMARSKKHLTCRQAGPKVGVSGQLLQTFEIDGKTALSRASKAFLPLCKLYDLDPDEIGRMIDNQKQAEREEKATKVDA